MSTKKQKTEGKRDRGIGWPTWYRWAAVCVYTRLSNRQKPSLRREVRFCKSQSSAAEWLLHWSRLFEEREYAGALVDGAARDTRVYGDPRVARAWMIENGGDMPFDPLVPPNC